LSDELSYKNSNSRQISRNRSNCKFITTFCLMAREILSAMP
jgi:hypothetical protein